MKLKKTALIASSILLTHIGIVSAASNAIPVGPNLGYGDASNNNTIFSTSANPAWISGNLHEENNYGFGITAGIRVKQNSLSELYKNYTNNLKSLLEGFNADDNNSLEKVGDIQQAFSNLVLDVRDNFYLQVDANFALPIAIANSRFGGVAIEASGLKTARSRILSSNKPVDININYLINNPNAEFNQIIDEGGLIIQSALYIKTATITEVALTYGNQFYQNEHGKMSIGVRAKYMQAKLVKSVNEFGKYLSSSADGNELAEQFNDDLAVHTDVSATENSFGVDLGLQWFAKNYMVGFSIMNINSPTFNYNKLGQNNDTNKSRVENFYANQIDLTEQVTLQPQARIAGALYSENRHWTLATSFDLNATNDLVNQEYQWFTTSVAYATDASGNWLKALIPDIRLGYRQNMVGDTRNYITSGITWGFLNLDVAVADLNDFAKIANADPEDMPESFMANLGIEFYF